MYQTKPKGVAASPGNQSPPLHHAPAWLCTAARRRTTGRRTQQGGVQGLPARAIRATFYRDEDILARHPLAPPLRENDCEFNPRAPAGSSCGVCLTPDSKVRMTLTRCCGQPVCDNGHEYQMFLFSREFCGRSHDRYTLCGYHGHKDECDKRKDWRECPGCYNPETVHDQADLLWRGLNPYNFTPLLSKHVPRHALCDKCTHCGRLFIMGLEGGSSSRSTRGGFVCSNCVYS
ncbi:MAG: hypothetical protein J3K34DRAFT_444068 [Monoraphidium minutum]|nr:MAG: hypothetical protein J3K34DRAFT_444068 [Monoraphidium minutum]